MGNENNQTTLTPTQVLERFDEILGKHLEQLIGSGYRIGTLPLNATTISCMTLLTEREIDIQHSPSSPPERYRDETLSQDLAELGVYDGLDTVLRELTERGYLEIAQDGWFVVKQRLISMTQLLDRVFPGMPGLNLVAYILQTIEEVLSGRKELATALSQFDQTLQMHGTALSTDPPGSEAIPAPTRSRASLKTQQVQTVQKELSPQEALALLRSQVKRQRKDKAAPTAGSVSIWEPKAMPSSGESGQLKTREPLPENGVDSEIAEDRCLEHGSEGNDILHDRPGTVPDTQDSPIEPTPSAETASFDEEPTVSA